MYIPIFSMARSKALLKQGLRNGNDVRLEHWMKLYFYPQAEYERQGWMRSVFHSCSRTYPVVGKRFLSPSEILEEVWAGDFSDSLNSPMYFGSVLAGVIDSVSEYKGPPQMLKSEWPEDFYSRFKEYHEWLSIILSNRGAIAPDECYAELTKLLIDCAYWIDFRNGFV